MRIIIFFAVLLVSAAHADAPPRQDVLLTIDASLNAIQARLDQQQHALNTAKTDSEKQRLRTSIAELEKAQEQEQQRFEEIAAGSGVVAIRARTGEKQEKNIVEELQFLVMPLISSAKSATREMREKMALVDAIDGYKQDLERIKAAQQSLQPLTDNAQTGGVSSRAQNLSQYWNTQMGIISNKLQAAERQLADMDRGKQTLTDSVQSGMKSFFKPRGLYIFEAIAASVGILMLFVFAHRLMVKLIPGFNAKRRSFRIRLIEMLFKIVAGVLVVAAPFAVFFLEEDWVLFSIGILLLVGMVWAFRNAIPDWVKQVRLLLNIGSVREGERIVYRYMPWRVARIDSFTRLENPEAGLRIRVPADRLVDLVSHPEHPSEPWFPCRLDDWVLLGDDFHGKVAGISPEMVEMIDRGGARKVLRMKDFFAASPINLSAGFRVRGLMRLAGNMADIERTLKELPQRLSQALTEGGVAPRHVDVECDEVVHDAFAIIALVDFGGKYASQYRQLCRKVHYTTARCCDALNLALADPSWYPPVAGGGGDYGD
jgi:flagellar hook-basal body complex protein FliE